MKIKTIQSNKNEELIEIFKNFSIIPLITTFVLEFESLLFFTIQLFSRNLFLTIILVILFHFFLLHYGIECFLFLVQFPIFGKISLYSNGSSNGNILIAALSNFIDICEKIVDNEQISLSEEYTNLLDIYERVNMLIYIYYEMKKKYGLSKYQKKLYEGLIIWRKHFKKYKVMQYFKQNKRYMGDYTNFTLNKNLIQLILDSNFIIKLTEDYVCDDFHFLSFKKIYNFLFNDTFCSMNQYKTVFNLKFKEKSRKFITSDNKIIDFTIIDSKKLMERIVNRIPFQSSIKNPFKKNNKELIDNLNKDEIIDEDEINDISNLSTISNFKKKIINKKRNLVILSNPNSMIYEFFFPERYFFYYEGGCDVLFWNYRGYGLSEGHSTFTNNRRDILEIFDEIKKMDKWEKYGVYGYSIGGISATHLAKNRDIDLLISDRNFSNLSRIAESYPCGRILKFLCKIFLLDKVKNEQNYLFTKKSNCCKVILCDPNDEVVENNGSVKSCISKYIIKNCIVNNKNENILDILFEKKELNKFIEALLNIMDFLDKNCLSKDNPFIQSLNNFFDCFIYGSEDLISFRNKSYKRLKIMNINNFFNNFFIWGTKKYEDITNEKETSYFNTDNNIFYLKKSIAILNDLKSLENDLLTLEQSNNIIFNIETLKNGIIQIKNKIPDIIISDDISKGTLIRLNCGHNTIFSGKEQNIVVEILEKHNFLK